MSYIYCWVNLFTFAPIFISEDGKGRRLGCAPIDTLPEALVAHCVENDIHHIRLFGNNSISSQIEEEVETLFRINYTNHPIEIEVN